MVVKAHICFAAGRVLTQQEAQYFGGEIAELAIILDYLDTTEGSLFGEKERDWWDEGPLKERNANYQAILGRRHRLSADRKKQLWGTSIPDILTYQGLDRNQLLFAASRRRTSTTVGVPNLIRLGAKKGARHEYYEIKPRNKSGQFDGTEKIEKIKKVYRDTGLPYAGGTLYPDLFYTDGIARIPLHTRNSRILKQWQRAIQVLKGRYGVARIDIYLEVSRKQVDPARPMPDGLLLYRVCVDIYAEKNKNDSTFLYIARNAVHAWTSCQTETRPEEVRVAVREAWQSFKPEAIAYDDKPARSIPDNQTLAPPRFPLIEVSYIEIWPKLAPTIDAVRHAMISRGIGLPGDEYLVCCNQPFYASLAADAVPLINLIRILHGMPFRWYGYVKDQGSLGLFNIVVEANGLLFQASELALDAFVDFKKWAHQNPGKAAVLAVVVIIIAAATIYFAAPVIAAELGLGVVAGEIATEGALTAGARIALAEATPGQLVRVGMRQQLMQDALIEEFGLQQLGRQAAQQTAQAIARQSAIPRSVEAASVARQALLSQARNQVGQQATDTLLRSAGPLLAAGGIGTTIAVSGRIAYAQTKGATAPMPEGDPIGIQVGHMFLLKADMAPALQPAWLPNISTSQPIKPQLGKPFDAARFSKEAADSLKPGGPSTMTCHYLGRLKVS